MLSRGQSGRAGGLPEQAICRKRRAAGKAAALSGLQWRGATIFRRRASPALHRETKCLSRAILRVAAALGVQSRSASGQGIAVKAAIGAADPPAERQHAMSPDDSTSLFPDTHPNTEVHAASPTAHLLEELALYGHRPYQDDPDPRPLPHPTPSRNTSMPRLALSAPCSTTRASRTIYPICSGLSSTCSTARSTASSASSKATRRRNARARTSRTAPRSNRSSSNA
jgi:hypothetical protein